MTTRLDAIRQREQAATEEWRDIAGVPHYQVSDRGRVRSFVKKGRNLNRIAAEPHLLAPRRDNRTGRLSVSIPDGGPQTYRTRHISHLVAAAFLGTKPSGTEVAHLNGDVSDNSSSNLAYVTHRENEGHKRAHGTTPGGERNGQSKLTRAIVDEMRSLAASGMRQVRIAEQMGYSRQLVSDVVRGKTW